MLEGDLSAALLVFDVLQKNLSNPRESNSIEIKHNFSHFLKLANLLLCSSFSENHNSIELLSLEQSSLGVSMKILVLLKRNPLISKQEIPWIEDLPLRSQGAFVDDELPLVQNALGELIGLEFSNKISAALNSSEGLRLYLSVQLLHQMEVLSLLLGETSHHAELGDQEDLLDSLVLLL